MPIKVEYDKKALKALWKAFHSWFIIISGIIGLVSLIMSVPILITNIGISSGVWSVEETGLPFIKWWAWCLMSLPLFIWLYHGIQHLIIKIVKWFRSVFKITRVEKEFDATRCKRYTKCRAQLLDNPYKIKWNYEDTDIKATVSEREYCNYTDESSQIEFPTNASTFSSGVLSYTDFYPDIEKTSQVSQEEFIAKELNGYTCDDCGDFMDTHKVGMRIYVEHDKHYTVCKGCFQENYKYCTKCGVPITGARYSDIKENYNYCEKCYFEEFEHG